MNSLKSILLEEYDGFADKRIKKLESGSIFIVDDRGDGDFGADKNLFLWFCSIFADVKSATNVEVRLVGGVPISQKVLAWSQSNNFELKESHQNSLLISLNVGEQHKLSELASLIEGIVESGATYSVAAYKYVCPRTANSLRRMEATLSNAWGI